MNEEEFVKPDAKMRLQKLLSKDFLSNEDIEEAFRLTQEIGMEIEDIPLRLMDQQIIRSLTLEKQKLQDERKLLQLQADIHNEKIAIEKLKENRSQPYWCEECQDWVID